MGRLHVPESLRRFVERQTTMPIADLWDGDRKERHSPYGSHWYRAVACILLSGRVHLRQKPGRNLRQKPGRNLRQKPGRNCRRSA